MMWLRITQNCKRIGLHIPYPKCVMPAIFGLYMQNIYIYIYMHTYTVYKHIYKYHGAKRSRLMNILPRYLERYRTDSSGQHKFNVIQLPEFIIQWHILTIGINPIMKVVSLYREIRTARHKMLYGFWLRVTHWTLSRLLFTGTTCW